MISRLLWWSALLVFIAIFVFIGALFLTPDFTYVCTDHLLGCIADGYDLPTWQRLTHTLVCTYHNVICVLGGLFV